MADMIQREMTKYCRRPSNIPKFTGSDSINSFCWKNVLAELQDTVPTLYKAVSSSMPNKLQNDDHEPKYACTMLLYMNLRFILCISRVIFSIYVIIISYLVLVFVFLKLISEKYFLTEDLEYALYFTILHTVLLISVIIKPLQRMLAFLS